MNRNQLKMKSEQLIGDSGKMIVKRRYNLSLQPYPKYRDSEVEWLGEVPEHWEVKRLKDIANLERGKFTHRPRNDERMYGGKYPFIQTGQVAIPTKYISDYKQTLSELGTSASREFKRGTLLMTIAANIGDVSILSFNAYMPDSIIALLSNTETNTDFLYYLLKASKKSLDRIKITNTQDNLNLERLNNDLRTFPPFSEQKAIAAYLDQKTAVIDRKIELLQKKAESYRNLRQSLINETVTRGLDRSVPTKPSGVQWIGDIPEHWGINRIGTAFSERSEKVSDKDFAPLSVSMKGIVPQMESVAKTDHNDNRKKVAKGDYVINSRSDRRGASGVSIYDGSVSVINIVLTPHHEFFGKYLHHLFRSYRFIEEFYRVGRGIVDDLWTTRYFVMKAIEFAIPPFKEQQKIADYLDQKTAQIDKIMDSIGKQIDTLKELRKTLINDVVTGKLKVIKL